MERILREVRFVKLVLTHERTPRAAKWLAGGLVVEMGSLMGGPIQFSPKDHYGTSWWRVYQYDANAKKFQAVSDWQEASSSPTLRKQ